MPQIASAYIQSEGAQDAADTQANAGNSAIAQTRAMYDQTRKDLNPWVTSGNTANTTLGSLFAPGGYLAGSVGTKFTPGTFGGVDMNADPGVQYRIDQANKGFEASAASRGRVLGGGAIKSLAELNQNLGSEEYGNAYTRQYGAFKDKNALDLETNTANNNLDLTNQSNLFQRLFGISGQGLTAAQGQAGANTDFSRSLSDLITGIGNVRASGIIGSANAESKGISDTANYGTSLAALLAKSGG